MSNTIVSLTHLFWIDKLDVDEEASLKRNWFYLGVSSCGIFAFVGVWFLFNALSALFFFAPFVEGQVLEGEWADKCMVLSRLLCGYQCSVNTVLRMLVVAHVNF